MNKNTKTNICQLWGGIIARRVKTTIVFLFLSFIIVFCCVSLDLPVSTFLQNHGHSDFAVWLPNAIYGPGFSTVTGGAIVYHALSKPERPAAEAATVTAKEGKAAKEILQGSINSPTTVVFLQLSEIIDADIVRP